MHLSLRVNSLSPALTAVIAVASFASFAKCYRLLAAKPQFHFNTSTLLRYLIPSLRVNSLSPAFLTAVTAVTSLASFGRCCKLSEAKPQFHFNVNIA